jgi:hypothetical protein
MIIGCVETAVILFETGLEDAIPHLLDFDWWVEFFVIMQWIIVSREWAEWGWDSHQTSCWIVRQGSWRVRGDKRIRNSAFSGRGRKLEVEKRVEMSGEQHGGSGVKVEWSPLY